MSPMIRRGEIPSPQRLVFELCARKTSDAPGHLPDQPAIVRQGLTGDHPTVFAEAKRLNDMQSAQYSKPAYLFFPEVVSSGRNWRTHCDVCRQLAARQARDEDAS